MAGPELKTKDDVPLYTLGQSAMEMVEVFNDEADRGFIDSVSQEVNSRTFLARTGDMTWDEVAELEHARTGSIEDYQMAFSVDTYAKDLGFSREYIEDTTAELIEDHVAELVAGGRQKMFDVTFDVMKNGIADGSQLWYSPEDHGAYTFTDTHNHTYTGLNNNATDSTRVLFNDSDAHTPTEIVRELSGELTHHGYTPDMAIVPGEFADHFIEERSAGHGGNYYVPQAENLMDTQYNDSDSLPVQPNGVTVMQTSWLKPDSNGDYPIYLYDSAQNPVKRNTVRPMELTDNSGAPVGGAGGFRGDPGALLGAYGTMRFGTTFDDPLAGAKIEAVGPSEISTN
jgi:hypothetical protein